MAAGVLVTAVAMSTVRAVGTGVATGGTVVRRRLSVGGVRRGVMAAGLGVRGLVLCFPGQSAWDEV